MSLKTSFVGGAAALALAIAPVSPASAHGYYHRWHGGRLFGLAALGAGFVVGAATIATAPLRALAAPVYAAPPPPAYYAPRYYAPPRACYAPPPGYYAAPYGYYGR